MKEGIHPKINPEATIRCGCGNIFTIPSTIAQMDVEICSKCHPFYTGTKKIVDAAGQVEKFRARLQKTQAMQTKKAPSKKKTS